MYWSQWSDEARINEQSSFDDWPWCLLESILYTLLTVLILLHIYFNLNVRRNKREWNFLKITNEWRLLFIGTVSVIFIIIMIWVVVSIYGIPLGYFLSLSLRDLVIYHTVKYEVISRWKKHLQVGGKIFDVLYIYSRVNDIIYSGNCIYSIDPWVLKLKLWSFMVNIFYVWIHASIYIYILFEELFILFFLLLWHIYQQVLLRVDEKITNWIYILN